MHYIVPILLISLGSLVVKIMVKEMAVALQAKIGISKMLYRKYPGGWGGDPLDLF